jgi:uncharacterized protein
LLDIFIGGRGYFDRGIFLSKQSLYSKTMALYSKIMTDKARITSRFLHLLVAAGIGLSMVFADTGVARADLASAFDRYRFGDYAGAIAEWEALGNAGDADALFNLGQVYRLGHGVDINLVTAEYLYRRAAEAGQIEAQNNLATIYYLGEGVDRRLGDAIRWWRTAARGGHAVAEYMMAILYFNGEGVPRDNIQAFAWIILAQEAGLGAATEAEAYIRSAITPNELNQGRLLARGLVDVPHNRSNLMLIIPTPVEINLSLVAAPGSPPEPPAPPAAPEVTVAEIFAPPRVPPTPPEPPQPPQARGSTPIAENTNPSSDYLVADDGPAPAGGDARDWANTGGVWRAQMGVFRSRDNAESLAAQLYIDAGDLLDGRSTAVVAIDLGPDRGIFYRVYVGPYNERAEVARACARFDARGIGCLPKSE